MMALRLYSDVQATQELGPSNPDSIRSAVTPGSTLVDERVIYLKSDDPNLTYENIVLEALGDNDNATESGQVNVEYALDQGGAPGVYQDPLPIPNGRYNTPTPIWRRVTAPNVTAAFARVDIEHYLTATEYPI